MSSAFSFDGRPYRRNRRQGRPSIGTVAQTLSLGRECFATNMHHRWWFLGGAPPRHRPPRGGSEGSFRSPTSDFTSIAISCPPAPLLTLSLGGGVPPRRLIINCDLGGCSPPCTPPHGGLGAAPVLNPSGVFRSNAFMT